MPIPVINFPAQATQGNPNGSLIVVNGDYFQQNQIGVPTKLAITGTFGGGTLTLSYYNDDLDAYQQVTGGSWTAGPVEDEFTIPFGIIRWQLSGATTPNLSIRTMPTKPTVHPA